MSNGIGSSLDGEVLAELTEPLVGCGLAGALVMPAGLHTVAADRHRTPAGAVRLAAVDQKQPALRVGARAQAAWAGHA